MIYYKISIKNNNNNNNFTRASHTDRMNCVYL